MRVKGTEAINHVSLYNVHFSQTEIKKRRKKKDWQKKTRNSEIITATDMTIKLYFD